MGFFATLRRARHIRWLYDRATGRCRVPLRAHAYIWLLDRLHPVGMLLPPETAHKAFMFSIGFVPKMNSRRPR